MLCDKVYRLRLVGYPSLPSFVEASLQSPGAVDRLNDLKTGISDSGVNLTQQGVVAFAIAMPPLAEQQRIITEVERVISVVDALEHTIQVQLIRAHALRQAVLKRAFEGKLVHQDPTDEPASVLLARIRAERAIEQEGDRRARKPRAVRGTLRQEATPGGQEDG
jgi:type I restriction enzyme S subunit